MRDIMAEISVHEYAIGLCVVCGKDSAGSHYWIGMSQALWIKIRPYLTHLFPSDMVQKVLFIPPYDKPLCGTTCSEKYHANE